jgi:hypothetical protein
VPKKRSFTLLPVEKMGQKVVTVEGEWASTHWRVGFFGVVLFGDGVSGSSLAQLHFKA